MTARRSRGGAAPSGAASPRLAYMPNAARRAGIYVRMSKDNELGAQRQIRAAREVIARKGWTEVEVYSDNDTSQWDWRTPRPGYERMMEDLAAGHIDAVAAYDTIRVYRHPRTLEELIDFVEEHRTAIEVASGGEVDLTTPEGRMLARMLGAHARMEVEKLSARTKLKHAELAREGWWRGGVAPYGYRLVRVRDDEGHSRGSLELEPSEAEVIIRIADAVLAGRSLIAIERELNGGGTAAPRGKRWHRATIRDLMLRPTVAGRVNLDGHDGGPAKWPAILPMDRWLVLRDTLQDPDRKRAKEPTQSLLAGLVYQQGSEQRLTIHIGPKPLRRRMYYLNRSQTPEGQPGVSIDAEHLEDWVAGFLFDALEARGPIAEEEDHDEQRVADLAANEASLAELADDFYVQKVIARPEFLRARRGLEEQRQALLGEAKAARHIDRSTKRMLEDPSTLRADWPAMPFEAKRQLLRDLIARVEVGPGGQGRTFASERVVVTLPD